MIHLQKSLEELSKLADGWDGEGSKGADPEAIINTQNFLRALPDDVPLPEFCLEPDGSISLDWIRTKRQLLSLSIGKSKRLAYAWTNGVDNYDSVGGGGTIDWDGCTIPTKLLEGIRTYYPGQAT